MYRCSIVVCGDLNIHVDVCNDSNAKKLAKLLDSFECKQQVHQLMLERRYRRTRFDTNRLAWVQQLNKMHALYEEKNHQHWRTKTADRKGNMKKLWRILSGIMGKRWPKRKTTATQRTTSRTSSPTRSRRFACQHHLCRFTTSQGRGSSPVNIICAASRHPIHGDTYLTHFLC